MSIALTLSIPELLNPLRVKEANEALDTLKLSALQTFVAKSDLFATKSQSPYALSSYLFHQPVVLDSNAALASVMASVEVEDYDPSVYWLRVDPVQMIADRDSLVLIPSQDLAISEAESKALLATFNAHFEQDKVALEYATAQHWYLRMAFPVDLKTHTVDSVAHQSVDDRYPSGNAANYWRKMINETQMLFFTHPVNEARREAGLPEINSIWVWGEGLLNESAIVERPEAMVWSNNVYLQGLATVANASVASSPANYAEWKAEKDSLTAQNSGGGGDISHHMIQLDDLSNALDVMQQSDWLSALHLLEKEWFEPLLCALKNEEIGSLLLEFGGESRYHMIPNYLNRFWRLKSSLKKL